MNVSMKQINRACSLVTRPDDSATVKTSNGKDNMVKKFRGKRSLKKTTDTSDMLAESNAAMDTEQARKTRQGKRSSSKRDSSRDDSLSAEDFAMKKVRKERYDITVSIINSVKISPRIII